MQVRGRFITLEGGEGVGKTTLAQALSARLGELGVETVLTREPGGCPSAEALREILYGPDSPHWSPAPETLLLYAARAAHLDETIRPALTRGAWVICDRFNDSTLAYQGMLGAIDTSILSTLANFVIRSDQPDLTFMLDLDPTLARSRAEQRGEYLSRYDRSAPEFHQKLRDAFRSIAAAHPDRCTVLDASRQPDALAHEAFQIVQSRFGLKTSDAK
ncbi:MAG: dTMP kinase [Caulobacterales bacterium]